MDGSIPHPTTTYLLFGAQTCCNNVVISWILNVITREVVDSLLHIDTTFEIQDDLHEKFHQSNDPYMFQIKKHLVTLHQGAFDVMLTILDSKPFKMCSRIFSWYLFTIVA